MSFMLMVIIVFGGLIITGFHLRYLRRANAIERPRLVAKERDALIDAREIRLALSPQNVAEYTAAATYAVVGRQARSYHRAGALCLALALLAVVGYLYPISPLAASEPLATLLAWLWLGVTSATALWMMSSTFLTALRLEKLEQSAAQYRRDSSWNSRSH